MGSAFSFSRTFNNTIFPEYRAESQDDYQDYPDCQEDMVSLLMSIQNDVTVQNFSPSIADEFDLSLIRGDPTSLLSNVDSPSSSSTTCLASDEQQEPFQSFNPPYYAVGHLVSSQQQSTTINLDSELVGAMDNFGNQVILPRNEGLLLGNNRRVTRSKIAETEKNDKSYGKYAVHCLYLL